jgi:1-acyl-sn-glycerol-3-phosphate acyltransferase
MASQSLAWLVSQLLRLGFVSEMHRPPGLFERGPERCLILAPTHQSVLDPFLLMSAMQYRHWRMLMPVRTLATQTFRRFPLTWLTPFIRMLYRIGGVVALPPKEEGGSLPQKLEGLLRALVKAMLWRSSPKGRSERSGSRRLATLRLA